MGIGEDLHLDMARVLDVFLDQHMVVAEAGGSLGPRRGKCAGKIPGLFHEAHALAAAAGAGLDEDRIADLLRLLDQEVRVLVLAVIAGCDGDASFLH